MRLRIVARVLVVGFIGLLLPFALTAQASAFVDPATLQATRFIAAGTAAETAGAVATKLAPLRMLTSVTPWGAVINLAVAGGLWWLTSTDSGQAVSASAWKWISGQIGSGNDNYEPVGGPAQSSGTYCNATTALTGGPWTRTAVSVTVTSVATAEGIRQGVDCSGIAQISGNYKFSCISTVAYTGYPVGSLSQGSSGSIPGPANTRVWAACSALNTLGQYVPVTLDIYGSTTYYRMVSAHFVNPNPVTVGTKTGTEALTAMMQEKDCKNSSTGAITVVVATGATGTSNIPSIGCPAGTYPIAQRIYSETCVNVNNCNGKRLLNTVTMEPTAAQQYPLCIGPGAAGCAMRVTIDGTNCDYGLVGCANWWALYKTQPERVKCLWGTYNLPVVTDCGALRNAYLTEFGAVADPALDPAAVPVPATTTQGTPWPSTEPIPGADPAPDPATDPGTSTFPSTGTNSAPLPDPNDATDGQNCMGAAWSWNPINWVYVPIKCATVWAFVPRAAVLDAEVATTKTTLNDTAPGKWVAAAGTVGAAMNHTDGGCLGPRVVWDKLPGGGMYPFSACDAPMDGVAAVTHLLATVAITFFGGLACMRALGSGLGWSPGAGGE